MIFTEHKDRPGMIGIVGTIMGDADVNISDFTETEVPEKPPQPATAVSEKPVTSAKFPEWGKDEWANWGLDIGQKVFRKVFDQTDDAGRNPGISIKVAKSKLNIRNLLAKKCIIRSARSDVALSDGSISFLDVNIIRGDINCLSCIPAGEWNLRANHGNINFSIAPDVTARLNASTRVGDINSSVPLVKVTRQGPGAWHGGRMVGTVGTPSDTKEKIPEIRLTSLRGNINIQAGSTSGISPDKPPAPKATPPPPKPSRKTKAAYKTPTEVLEALSEGQISVDDAEGILDELGYWNKPD